MRALYTAIIAFAIAGVASGSPWPVKISEPYDLPPKGYPELTHPGPNIALNKPVTGSDPFPIIGEYGLVTDGDRGHTERHLKEIGLFASPDGCFLELGPPVQYVQIDLKETTRLGAVWIWNHHRIESYDIPSDTVVQISNDPEFDGKAGSVSTVFNSDADNSLGFGAGCDRRYAVSRFGKLIEFAPVTGRYLRVWGKGGVRNEFSCFVEIEVYGAPLELAGPTAGWGIGVALAGLLAAASVGGVWLAVRPGGRGGDTSTGERRHSVIRSALNV